MRGLYLTFYILYLITLAIGLWFLFYYGTVPQWVYIFFGIAIILAIIGALIKEFLMKQVYETTGKFVNSKSFAGWGSIYLILHVMSFILLIVGLAFVIKYSNIPWWVWLIVLGSFLLLLISTILMAFTPKAKTLSLVLIVIGYILFFIAIIFIVTYSLAPWWVWLIIILACIFSILASVFEQMTYKQQEITTKSNCQCATPENIYTFDELPNYTLPEQTI